MATNKRITNLKDYTSVLPYASEIFGVYQPLLGWKSKRIEARFNKGHLNDKQRIIESLSQKFKGIFEIKQNGDPANPVSHCSIDLTISSAQIINGQKKKSDSILLNTISSKLPVFEEYKESVWDDLLNPDRINIFLNEFVKPHYLNAYSQICSSANEFVGRLSSFHVDKLPDLKKALEIDLNFESSMAGALAYLNTHKQFDALKDMFYAAKDNTSQLNEILNIINAKSPQDAYLSIDNINPRDSEHLKSVGLSPISIVHLFRQYFYEFDTFLGSPVNHIWLSPGSTVELIETSSRKTIIEKTTESFVESISKAEDSTTNRDELSDAVKEDNKKETKFGATVSGHQGWIGGEANASATLDMGKTQQTAKEHTKKQMTEQTKKLSTEIRQNFKSTFKTITEFTDTSSKRYVLSNNTKELVNYELRRKMRQVGIQLQDIGTYLCWQSYVDDPGAQLGLSELVHISKTPDIGTVPHPATPTLPEPFEQVEEMSIPFIGLNGNDTKDDTYEHGIEHDNGIGDSIGNIQCDFPQHFFCEKPNFVLAENGISLEGLDDVQPVIRTDSKDAVIDANGKKLFYKSQGRNITFMLHLNTVNFHDKDSVNIRVKLRWVPAPDALAQLDAKAKKEYEDELKNFEAEKELKFKKAFIDAAKERIKLASKITSRKYEDLREEERIVVYRKLIQDMLMKGIAFPDDATRHVVSELVNAIFDVDKMLYFVAPEWWRPRLHQSHQNLGKYKAPDAKAVQAKTGLSHELAEKISLMPAFAKDMITPFKIGDSERDTPMNEHKVGWGGVNGQRKDNYYITEDSDPAKLGSSLGWLMQLDGDNLRNAFLNAPWVKAVIPIRPGKEAAAINWLKKVEGMNGISDADIYHTEDPNEKDSKGNPLNGQKMIDVLLDLAKKVKQKHEDELKIGVYPKQEPGDPVIDPASTVTTTPVDRVYEHGFYPLQNSFRNSPAEENFSVFSQWVEILPTDQIVAVEVKYDPKTGLQI